MRERTKDLVAVSVVAVCIGSMLMSGGLIVANRALNETGRVIATALKPTVIHVRVNRTAKGDYGVFKDAVVQESSGAHCFEPFCVID